MKRALLSLGALACLGLLAVGCTPQADTPPLDNQATEAKKMPGADTPPATTAVDANAAKKAKTGD